MRTPTDWSGDRPGFIALSLIALCSSVVAITLGGQKLYATDLAPGGPIVINEVNYNPPREFGSDDDFEFVELLNRTDSPVDVGGWSLDDDSSNPQFGIPSGTVLPAGGFLVLARNAAAMRERYGSGLPVIGNVSFPLSNGGDVIRLFNPAGELVDRLEYGDDLPWDPLADAEGSTLERISATEDITDFSNFAASVASNLMGTPGAANSRAGEIPARHAVVINEILYHPVKDPDERTLRHCPDEEFLELFNRGDTAVDLSGWRLGDEIQFTFPAGTSIAAGEHLVVFHDESAFRARFGADADAVGPYSGELPNGGGDVVLFDAEERVADFVDFNDQPPWPINPDGLRGSLELIDPLSDNDRGQAWRESFDFNGTAGALNSATAAFEAAGDNVGPQITGVEARPAAELDRDEILSTDAVRIEARVADRQGVANVTLEYQHMAPGAYIRRTDPTFETDWTSLPMSYDADLGKHVATVPAQPHRTLVRYRVRATDLATSALESVAPFANDPEPNFGYFVYDGIPDYVATNSAFGESGFTHTNLDKVPVYFIVGHPDDIEQVQFEVIPEDMFSLYRHRVTFVHEGRVYDHVGVRLRGSITSRFGSAKRSWKIKFNKGNRFRGRFNNGERYPNRRSKANIVRAENSGLVESLALKVYRDCGVMASQTTFVHLRIVDTPNETGQRDGDLFGLYLDLQGIDKVMLRDQGRPTDEASSIYKFRGFPDKQHSDCDPLDRSDVDSFLDVALSSSGDQAFFEQNLDIHRYLSFRTATELTNNNDMDSLKNYFYYFDSESAKWEVLPWDLDGAFSNTSGEEPLQRALRFFPIEFENRFRFLWQVAYGEDRLRQILSDWTSLIKEIADADVDRWGTRRVEENADMLVGESDALRRTLLPLFVDPTIPRTPVNTEPFTGAVQSPPIVLKTRAFVDPDAGDTHAASRWLLISASGDWVEPLWDFESDADLLSVTLPDDLMLEDGSYLFRAAHLDSSGRWSYLSDPTEFKIGPADTSGPASPSLVESSHVGFRSVVIRWSGSSDPDSGVLGYRIFRDGVLLTGDLIDGEEFVDVTVTPGAQHRYEVVAINGAGVASETAAELVVDVPAQNQLGGWLRPPEGFDYLYDASVGADQFSDARLNPVAPLLDGTWISSSLSTWDGSAPEEGSPGGVEVRVLSEMAEDNGPATVLSLEDPESPVDRELDNSRLIFLRPLGETNDFADGVTLVARLRVNPAAKGQEPGTPVRGQVGIAHRSSTARVHYALWLDEGQLHSSTRESVDVSMSEFQSMWITIEPAGDEHRVRLYLNGESEPRSDATLRLPSSGTETGFEGTYLEVGLANRTDFGAIDIDYVGFKRGVFAPVTATSNRGFIRGDANGDGSVTLDDALTVLNFLFRGTAGVACEDAADADDSGRLNVSDGIRVLLFLFRGASPLPAPYPNCGEDSSDDALMECPTAPCET